MGYQELLLKVMKQEVKAYVYDVRLENLPIE